MSDLFCSFLTNERSSVFIHLEDNQIAFLSAFEGLKER